MADTQKQTQSWFHNLQVIGILLAVGIVGAMAFTARNRSAQAPGSPVIESPSAQTPSIPAPTASPDVSGGSSPAATGATVPVPARSSIALTLTSPQNKSTVTTPTITVRGKTSPRADVAVNDTETVADANGNFSVPLTLDEGENYIIVVVNDENGNVAEQELYITYNSE